MRASFGVLAVASIASAQTLGGLSQSCTSAATSLITGPFSQCAQLPSLVSVITGGGGSANLISSVNTYLSGVCPAATCNSSTTTSAAQSIQSGCSTDLQQGNALAGALYLVAANYTNVRSALCTQATANSTYCVTNLLNTVQQQTGQNLTANTLISLVSGGGFSNFTTSALCTDCGHALYTELSPLAATVASNITSTSNVDTAQSAVASKCGSSFVDGKIPSSVAIQSGIASSGSPSASGSGSAASGATSSRASGAADHLDISVGPIVAMLGSVTVAGFGAMLLL